MANTLRFTSFLHDLETVEISDDFTEAVVTGDRWTTLVADTTPTVTTPDAINGLCRLFTDTTDNNEVAIRSTIELFRYGTNRAFYGRFKIQYTENDTNKANVFVGFANAIGANMITDNGGAIRASGEIAGIYKLDGATVWRCHTRNNSVTTDTVTTKTAGGTAAQIVEIDAVEASGTTMTVTFKVDGDYLRDSNNLPIRHTVTVASSNEMNIGVYVKTGGGAGGETLDIDYICGLQTRV